MRMSRLDRVLMDSATPAQREALQGMGRCRRLALQRAVRRLRRAGSREQLEAALTKELNTEKRRGERGGVVGFDPATITIILSILSTIISLLWQWWLSRRKGPDANEVLTALEQEAGE